MNNREALSCSEIPNNSDTISRQQAIDAVAKWIFGVFGIKESDGAVTVFKRLRELPSIQPDASKYEYHYDHTDCIWYGNGSNKCPSTCSQYRDGWNDAMQYIFGNGKGYKPYRRDGHHE